MVAAWPSLPSEKVMMLTRSSGPMEGYCAYTRSICSTSVRSEPMS